MFTKEVTTRVIVETIDADTPTDWAYYSVMPQSKTTVNLVIGSMYQNARASAFSKKGIEELIRELQKLADAMEYYK